MLTHQRPDQPPKKAGKKIAVMLSEGIDPEISIELIALMYEGSDLELVSFEHQASQEDGLIGAEDPIEPLMIRVKTEIICPILPVFDSEIFVLNYQKFYEE